MQSIPWCTLKRVPGEDSFPEKCPRGRLVCLCVVCPLVHPEKGPRGDLSVLCVVCPLKRAPGEDLSILCVVCPLKRVPCRGRLVRHLCCLSSVLFVLWYWGARGRLVSGFCRIVWGKSMHK